MTFPYSYEITSILVGIVYPVYIILDGEKTKQLLLTQPHQKIKIYQTTIILQFILVGFVFGSMAINNNDLSTIGLSFLKNPIWVSALIVGNLLILGLLNILEIPASKAEGLKAQHKDFLYIVPTTILEYRWAIFTSFMVGAFEEILFRGFLFWQVNQFVPWAPAMIIVNLLFGICHIKTGKKNALNTFLLGMFWSGIYLLTGSLWLSIFLHILVDIYASTMAKKLFVDKI